MKYINPLTTTVRSHLLYYPTPASLSYFWNFGSLAGFCLVIQIFSGLFLAMHYSADTALAFASVEHIMRDVNYGWLLSIHMQMALMFLFEVFGLFGDKKIKQIFKNSSTRYLKICNIFLNFKINGRVL